MLKKIPNFVINFPQLTNVMSNISLKDSSRCLTGSGDTGDFPSSCAAVSMWTLSLEVIADKQLLGTIQVLGSKTFALYIESGNSNKHQYLKKEFV